MSLIFAVTNSGARVRGTVFVCVVAEYHRLVIYKEMKYIWLMALTAGKSTSMALTSMQDLMRVFTLPSSSRRWKGREKRRSNLLL